MGSSCGWVGDLRGHHVDSRQVRHSTHRLRRGDSGAHHRCTGVCLAHGGRGWIHPHHRADHAPLAPLPGALRPCYRRELDLLLQGALDGRRQQGRAHRQVLDGAHGASRHRALWRDREPCREACGLRGNPRGHAPHDRAQAAGPRRPGQLVDVVRRGLRRLCRAHVDSRKGWHRGRGV